MRWFWICVGLPALAACSAGEPAAAVVPVEQPPVDYVTQRHLPCLRTTVTLTTNSISDANGFVNPSLASAVAGALNGAGVTAWCTGNHNAVVLSRTALTTGGGADVNGFAGGAIYDLWITIPGALSTNTGSDLVDGTSDGAGNGPGAGVGSSYYVSSFGPSGPGVAVVFAQEGGTGNVRAVSNASPTSEAANATFTNSNARLVAGQYSGTVTLTLTPGL